MLDREGEEGQRDVPAALPQETAMKLAAHRARVTAVRTGTHTGFATVPHTHVLDSVTGLPALLDALDAG
ncbi:hypothetical protein ABZ776_35300 [Streptomyces sp. NPDC007076]|uniref:hypothetical protein n=1 Tax=unclassified Streptomyces TaxID=2593676 RepID=UPI0033907D55